MILARLLTPAELGVYSVAMALLALASTLRDMGAGNYLLQEKDLTTDRIRAVWAVQLGLGILLGLVVALLAIPAAQFYDEPAIGQIMLLLALTYLVNPFGSLTYAWLMREMRYDAIATMRFSSTLFGAVISLVLAWRGHGAISLAWGSLCGTVVNAGVSIFYRPVGYPWIPGIKDLSKVLSFGAKLTSTSILTTLSAAAPEFLLGKTQGMAATGYYSRANGLVALFNRLVTDAVYPVALSMFSQQARSGQNYAESFMRAIAYLTALSWSFTVGLLLLAHPTTLLLYGEQWLAAVPMTRWLAVAAAISVSIPLCTAALIGAGQLAQMLRAALITTLATVGAAAAGAAFGLHVLGISLVLASMISIAAWHSITQRYVGFTWIAMARCSVHSAIVAAATGLGPLVAVLIYGWQPHSVFSPLLLGASLGVIGFLAAVLISNHPLADEIRRGASIVAARLRALQT